MTMTRENRSISPPQELKTWLYGQGSLTHQLMLTAHGQFHVEMKEVGFRRIDAHLALWLGSRPDQLGWYRETFLYGCDSEPWVSASSFFPIQTMQSRGRIFRHLGDRPIGPILFGRVSPLCKRRVVALPQGWARQSAYQWYGQRIWVQEIFLPRFLQHLRHGQLSV